MHDGGEIRQSLTFATLESQFSEENRPAGIAAQVNRKTKLAPLMFLLKSQTLRQSPPGLRLAGRI